MNIATDILTRTGYNTSYWGKKIIAAEQRGYFTESNKDQSGNWVTCACGKSCGSIEFEYKDGYPVRPVDPNLYSLGIDFNNAVEMNCFVKAAEVLLDIERRVIELSRVSLRNPSTVGG